MAVVIRRKSGKKFVLLNPAEKAKRYARQLKNDETLTDSERAYRKGYLNSRSDSAKVFNAKYR